MSGIDAAIELHIERKLNELERTNAARIVELEKTLAKDIRNGMADINRLLQTQNTFITQLQGEVKAAAEADATAIETLEKIENRLWSGQGSTISSRLNSVEAQVEGVLKVLEDTSVQINDISVQVKEAASFSTRDSGSVQALPPSEPTPLSLQLVLRQSDNRTKLLLAIITAFITLFPLIMTFLANWFLGLGPSP